GRIRHGGRRRTGARQRLGRRRTTVTDRALTISVALPAGRVEVAAAIGAPADPWAVVALAHGAGAGHGHPFLVGVAAALQAAGAAVVRFDFPYVAAGRRMPGPAAHAIAAWAAVVQ